MFFRIPRHGLFDYCRHHRFIIIIISSRHFARFHFCRFIITTHLSDFISRPIEYYHVENNNFDRSLLINYYFTTGIITPDATLPPSPRLLIFIISDAHTVEYTPTPLCIYAYHNTPITITTDAAHY